MRRRGTLLSPLEACVVGALALGLLGAGCDMDLATGVRLDRPRVLAVRVDVEGDPARAAPRPGEEVTLRWLVDGSSAWTSTMTACVAAPANQGLPGCASEPFAVSFADAPNDAPVFSMSIPEPGAFVAGAEVLVAGVLCAEGAPIAPEDGLPTCSPEGATTELVTFTFPVAVDSTPPNLHPTLDDETTTIDGARWDAPPDDLPTRDCAARPADDALPHLVRAEEESPSTVRISASPEDREPYARVVLGEDGPMLEDVREELTITHVATEGTFARLQTLVYDDDLPDPEVLWRHPTAEVVPEGGLTVRFVFVARDGRGGMAWIRRALCIEP